jgi:hypothetical protein
VGPVTRSGEERGELLAVSTALLGCFAAVLAVVVLLVVVPSGGLAADSGTLVSRAEMGERWPFKVSSGLLRCERGSEVTFQADGTSYTLTRGVVNGAHADVGSLLLDASGGAEKDLGPLVERGLRLCD